MLLFNGFKKETPLHVDWRHEKGKNEKGSSERYARDTHYACLWLEAMALFNPRSLHLTVSARMTE